MDSDRYLAAEHALFADAGIDPAQRWLDLPSAARVRVLEHGSGTPVLFLHGGPSAAATWVYVAAAAEGLRCLLLDRPGCGLSDPPRNFPADPASVAGYVSSLTAEVLDAFDIERAVLVGSSFGGYGALCSALAYPERIGGIVLAGCPALVPGFSEPAFFRVLRTPVLGRVVLALPPNARSVRMLMRQMGHSATLAEGRVTQPVLDWTLAWQRHTPTMRNDATPIVSFGTWRHGFDPAILLTTEELSRIDVPVNLCFGTDDPIGGRDVADRLAAVLPNSTVDCLPDSGHFPWLDDPAWLAAAIQSTTHDTFSS